jgi:hypothetical protein
VLNSRSFEPARQSANPAARLPSTVATVTAVATDQGTSRLVMTMSRNAWAVIVSVGTCHIDVSVPSLRPSSSSTYHCRVAGSIGSRTSSLGWQGIRRKCKVETGPVHEIDTTGSVRQIQRTLHAIVNSTR